VLSRLFRRLFLEALADAHAAGRLAFFGEIEGLRRREAFAAHLAPLRKKNWFVYAKPPFAGPEAVLCLSRPLHSSRRHREQPADQPRRTRRHLPPTRTIAATAGPGSAHDARPDEFIRRFLLHVLPKGFHRIRHYGLLASARCKANIARARVLWPPQCRRSTRRLEHGRGPGRRSLPQTIGRHALVAVAA